MCGRVKNLNHVQFLINYSFLCIEQYPITYLFCHEFQFQPSVERKSLKIFYVNNFVTHKWRSIITLACNLYLLCLHSFHFTNIFTNLCELWIMNSTKMKGQSEILAKNFDYEDIHELLIRFNETFWESTTT